MLKIHECLLVRHAFIGRISVIVELNREAKQKASRVLFHLLSSRLPGTDAETFPQYRLSPDTKRSSYHSSIYFYILPDRPVSAYLHATKFDVGNRSHNYIMATTRVIKLPRDDDESAHVLIQVASKGSKPLDVKLVGTEGEAPYVATCTVSPSAKPPLQILIPASET